MEFLKFSEILGGIGLLTVSSWQWRLALVITFKVAAILIGDYKIFLNIRKRRPYVSGRGILVIGLLQKLLQKFHQKGSENPFPRLN